MTGYEGRASVYDYLPYVEGCFYENCMVFVGFSAALLGVEAYQTSYCSFLMFEDSLQVNVGISTPYQDTSFLSQKIMTIHIKKIYFDAGISNKGKKFLQRH